MPFSSMDPVFAFPIPGFYHLLVSKAELSRSHKKRPQDLN